MNKIDIKYLSVENIRQKPLRSLGLILFVALFAFTLLAGSLTTLSLSRGLASLSDRLGADIMVIPQGQESTVDGILLKGSPSEFYLPKNTLEKLKDIDGIAKMTPQTYIATLSASCCSYPVQIIGIEPTSDFLISPWLDNVIDRPLEVGECIVGSRVVGEPGERIKFFEKSYSIVGRLEQTGMGFDASVFVNDKTSQAMAIDAQRIKKHPLVDDGDLISTIMIKVAPNYKPEDITRQINTQYAKDGIVSIYSKTFVNDISNNLQIIMQIVKTAIIVIWILAIIVLALVFAMILRERKKEFATLRILGAKKGQLNYLMLRESTVISFIGALIGIALGYLFVFFYGTQIADKMSIPFLSPSLLILLGWGLGCFFVSLSVAPLASLYALRRLAKWEIDKQFRDDE